VQSFGLTRDKWGQNPERETTVTKTSALVRVPVPSSIVASQKEDDHDDGDKSDSDPEETWGTA